MTYEVNLRLADILRTTLYLLDHTSYPGKQTKTVAELRECLVRAIAELAAASAKAENPEER